MVNFWLSRHSNSGSDFIADFEPWTELLNLELQPIDLPCEVRLHCGFLLFLQQGILVWREGHTAIWLSGPGSAEMGLARFRQKFYVLVMSQFMLVQKALFMPMPMPVTMIQLCFWSVSSLWLWLSGWECGVRVIARNCETWAMAWAFNFQILVGLQLQRLGIWWMNDAIYSFLSRTGW